MASSSSLHSFLLIPSETLKAQVFPSASLGTFGFSQLPFVQCIKPFLKLRGISLVHSADSSVHLLQTWPDFPAKWTPSLVLILCIKCFLATVVKVLIERTQCRKGCFGFRFRDINVSWWGGYGSWGGGESAGIPVFVMSESHLDKAGSKKWNWGGK